LRLTRLGLARVSPSGSCTPAEVNKTRAAAFAAAAMPGSPRTSAAMIAPSIKIAIWVAKPSGSIGVVKCANVKERWK
jgi:hypothetical protein